MQDISEQGSHIDREINYPILNFQILSMQDKNLAFHAVLYIFQGFIKCPKPHFQAFYNLIIPTFSRQI